MAGSGSTRRLAAFVLGVSTYAVPPAWASRAAPSAESQPAVLDQPDPDEERRRRARRAEVAKGLFFVGVAAIETVTFPTLAWLDRDGSRGRRLGVLGAAGGGGALGFAAGGWLANRTGTQHPRLMGWTGALLGVAAGGVLGWYTTREPGWSRPATTAAGMLPVFIIMTDKHWPW